MDTIKYYKISTKYMFQIPIRDEGSYRSDPIKCKATRGSKANT